MTFFQLIHPKLSKAFDEALKRGFDGFELDAILTADNHFIVVHDDDLSQTTNCKGFASNLQASELTKCSSRKNSILPVTQKLKIDQK